MKPLLQRMTGFARTDRYWAAVFFAFFCTYLLPLGTGPVKSVFYLGILLPAFLFSGRQDYQTMLGSRHFLIATALCIYALVRAADTETALDIAKFFVMFLAMSLGASRLPTATLGTIRRAALLFLSVLAAYVLANAVHQGLALNWVPGRRLAPLFGNLKSVIFCADLMVSALIVYSWTCLAGRNYRALFITNTVVIVFVLWLLQSRSALPAWLGSMTILLLFAVPVAERRRVMLSLGLLAVAVAVLAGNALPELLKRGDGYRLEIWSGYLSSMLECSALVGCGWGIELPFTTADGQPIAHPHSMYVQHLFWGGAVGLALLLAALCAPLVAGLRRAHYAAWALLPGCIALAFDGKSLIAQLNERWFLVTVPLAILIAACARQSAPRSRPPPGNAAPGKHLY